VPNKRCQKRRFIIFQQLIETLLKSETLFITAHVGPDGDTLGSMLGLKLALQAHCPNLKQIDCVISGKMPDVYRFLPAIETVLQLETQPQLPSRYDVAMSVDCGSIDRLGLAGKYLQQAVTSVNIDHHISNTGFADINVVVPTAAASAEVVFDLLTEMGAPVSAEVATCLYTGIVSDTGGFKYSNTTPKVMQIVSELIEKGASPDAIFKCLFDEQPLTKLRLHAHAFLNCQFNTGKTIAWTLVSKALLVQYETLDEHVDGLVESLRRIDSVLIAFVLKETENGNTKVSIRSDRQDIDVAEVMGVFSGGGHRLAAGCTIETPLEDALTRLLPLLEEKVNQFYALAQ
jgi:bifunctional oligoribonuclease and PAP phosphatase NrnA